jgi:hypothetical protein
VTTALAFAAMIVKQTAAEILAIGLEVAVSVGLPVTSWRKGDPTRSQYKYLAVVLESLEEQNSEFIKAGFLSTAEGDWKKIVAEENFGVTPGEATYATPTVTLTNTGTRHYDLDAGDIVGRSSVTGKTYHSTEAGEWFGGDVVTLSFIADEAGSDSNVGVDEIDELVTTFLGLEITGSSAATANDAEDDDAIQSACEDSRGALSPDGPADVYRFVVKNSELTGSSEITRAESIDDSDEFEIAVYVAGGAGPVSSGAITAAQDAVEIHATPLCAKPTVINATPLAVPLNAEISGDLADDWDSRATEAWSTLINTYRIGGKVLTRSTINKTLRNAVPESDNVTIIAPAVDVEPDVDEVMTVSSVNLTEV